MNPIFATVVIQMIFLLFGEIEMASDSPTNARALQAALDQAGPGDVITLLPRRYEGNFVISNSGFTLAGTSYRDRYTIVTSGSGVVFDIRANHVQIQKMTVQSADLAFNVQGSGNVIRALLIKDVARGVVINGDQNIVKECQIDSTDVGISIESGQGNNMESNTLSSLSISEQASGGKLSGSQVKGLLDIKGSQYRITGVQAEGNVDIQGCSNVLNGDYFQGSSNIAECNNYRSASNVFGSF